MSTTTVKTIFSNIKADTTSAAKAVATTISNGTTLLADGYSVRTYNKRNYRAESPEGEVYVVTYNTQAEHFHCTCKSWEHVGVCKHAAAIHLFKAQIDAEMDARNAAHDAERNAEFVAMAAMIENGETSEGCDRYAEL